MLHLPAALAAWNTSAFAAVLKHELESLGPAALPLQDCLRVSSAVLDTPLEVLVFGAVARSNCIEAKIGVFFDGIVAGCNCADDPTPVEAQHEYCELLVAIDKRTGQASVVEVG